MKPIIKYAVIRSYGVRGPFILIGVTTVKGRQVYGRFLHDEASTHVAECDVLCFVPTAERAYSLLERAGAVKAKHKRAIDDAQRALVRAQATERKELEALIAAEQADRT